MSSGVSVSSRRLSAPDPGGFNPDGRNFQTGEEPGGVEPVPVSPRLPFSPQPPTPRGHRLSQQHSRDHSEKSVLELLEQQQQSQQQQHKLRQHSPKISPISTAVTEASSASHSPATTSSSVVSERLRAARAIYESETLVLPETSTTPASRRPLATPPPVAQASPTASLATQPHRNTVASASDSVSEANTSTTGASANRRRSGSRGRARRSKTPEGRRGRSKSADSKRRWRQKSTESVGDASSQDDSKKGFFRRMLRRNKKDAKTVDGSEMEDTKMSNSTVSTLAPALKIDPSVASSKPVARKTPRPSSNKSQASRAAASASLPQNPTASSMDESHEDHPEVFFAHDDVSTLTGPTMHDEFPISTRSRQPDNLMPSTSQTSRSSRDPEESIPATTSTLSGDPMGFYYQGFPIDVVQEDPEEPYDEAASTVKTPSSRRGTAIDPFTEPFFQNSSRGPPAERNERRRSLKDPSPRGSAGVQRHFDPLGASPTHRLGHEGSEFDSADPPLQPVYDSPSDSEEEEEKKDEEPTMSQAVILQQLKMAPPPPPPPGTKKSKSKRGTTPRNKSPVKSGVRTPIDVEQALAAPPPPPPPGSPKKSPRKLVHSSSDIKKAKNARKAKREAQEEKVEEISEEELRRAKEQAAAVEFITKKKAKHVFDSDTGRQVKEEVPKPEPSKQEVPKSEPPPTKHERKSSISSLAKMNAKAVAYLHTLEGEPSPRHQWNSGVSDVSPSNSGLGEDAIFFKAYSTKFKGRKLTSKANASPRSSSPKKASPKSQEESDNTNWMDKPMNRDITIGAETVARGLAMRKAYREAMIMEGKAQRVVPSPSKKKNREPASMMTEPRDPIQRAGHRLLARAAIPIQAEFRRFLAQREAVDRMWALIEIQSYMRRWRAEAHVLACAQAVIVIQRFARGFVTRVTLEKEKEAAIQVQRIVRGHLASLWAYSTVYSVILIQAQVRGYFARRDFKSSRDIIRYDAACLIQSAWRRVSALQAYQFVVVDVIIAQSVARSWLARRAVKKQKETIAATKIQTQWRRFKGQMTLLYDLVNIIVVQSVVRRHMAMKEVWKRKIEKQDEIACATRIQAAWRGFWQYSHYLIMHYEVCRIQAVCRGMIARNEHRLQTGSAILIQSVIRRFQQKGTIHRERRVNLLRYSKSKEMREVHACEKIQMWWRVVLDCRKEKKAALTIERFFIMVKNEVEQEIRKYEKKKSSRQKRGKKHRKKKDADEKMLEKVWLNTVDENQVEVFRVPTSVRSYGTGISNSPSSQSGISGMSSTSSAITGMTGPPSNRNGRASRPVLPPSSAKKSSAPENERSNFSFSSSHLSSRVNKLREKVSNSDLNGQGPIDAEQEMKKRAADKYLKMYGVNSTPNRNSKEFFSGESPVAKGRKSFGDGPSSEWKSPRSPSKAKATAQKYIEKRKGEKQPVNSMRVGPILGEGIGMI